MLRFGIKNKFLRFRSTVTVLAAVGLFFVCGSSLAQRAGGNSPSRFMDRLETEEAADVLATFRQQRLNGDFCFRFQLEHKPKGARSTRFDGMMWGSWNEIGAVTRFKLFPKDESGPVEYIVQNGKETKAYIRKAGSKVFTALEGEDYFAPVVPGLLYSAFDLQMPFVFWEEYSYEGPRLIGRSRVGQQFLMHAPEGSASAARGIKGVRISLDDDYRNLWRIELIDDSDAVKSDFEVRSVKEVQGQYIVKWISLTSYPSKDSTDFNVRAAVMNLSFDREIFSPEGTAEPPNIANHMFEKL